MSEKSPILSEQKNAGNIENNVVEKVKFPNSRKILCLSFFTSLVTLGLCFVCHSWFSFDQCEATNSFEPCNFTNRLNYNEIRQLIKQHNESLKNFDLIGRNGKEDSRKREKAFQKIVKLSKKYEYQKMHQQKCYFEYMEKTYKNLRFYQKFIIYSNTFIVLFITFPILCYYYQKGKQSFSSFSEEEIKAQKVHFQIIVNFLLTCFLILGLTFYHDFQLPSNLDVKDLFDVPLGIDEHTKCVTE